MFEPSETPRVFALPPGVDFPRALLDGLDRRLAGSPPEALAQVHLIVNTRRMARRIRAIYDAGPARLLPRVMLVTGLDAFAAGIDLPPPVPSLRRRLELSTLIGHLLDRQPDLAARASQFDLADSLAALLDEMQGEGVSADAIRKLDVEDMSGHWARTQAFIDIAGKYTGDDPDAVPDVQARQRMVVQALCAAWQEKPPAHPVIVAGSTGSRGTTQMLMAAVSKLPQGAVVLPGFDFDQPDQVWDLMAKDDSPDRARPEDHPQYRFCDLMTRLKIAPRDVQRWTDARPRSPDRNLLVSLALRPAPVTDAWMTEGPELIGLDAATADMTLIEAPTPRAEALTIALRLRQAAETGQSAALITPDRMLSRQVTAALDRWRILPDDSAGTPLHLTPPGRFLRHVAGLFANRLTVEALLTLLKHPLCHDGGERGQHLLNTRDLELQLRRNGPPFPDRDSLGAIARAADDSERAGWFGWLFASVCDLATDGARPLPFWVELLMRTAEAIAGGSVGPPGGTLWDKNAGQAARAILRTLETEAGHGSDMTASAFADLLGALLAGEEVRDRDAPHPRIMIWGTLEARVQGAELLILGGLNEGSWPEAPSPDPWLNRQMRLKAGLLLPERRIGLSAHDFQQAVAAPEVWLTRSLRSDDADTVASRWLNRLTGLLEGLPVQGGQRALANMRDRGATWLDWAGSLDDAPRQAAAIRPSPRPPVTARPKRLSVTEIKRLIRDPYAVYARHVLRLKPLEPLVQTPDALLRGTVLHDVLEELIRQSLADPAILTREAFVDLARARLLQHVPWPAARRLWLARVDRIADTFVAEEIQRQSQATPFAFEAKAECRLDPLNVTISARADRIDRDDQGRLILYDYKSGAPPTVAQQVLFDKQLLIEAAMAENGAFRDIPPAEVAGAQFIGLGTSPKTVDAPLEDDPPAQVWKELIALVAAYQDPAQGYTARRMLHKDSDKGDFDHLARFGEWDRSATPTPEDLS